MGQFHDSTMAQRVMFDEKSENGLIMGNKYLPEELLTEIFSYVDSSSLLNCHLVCKRWKILIQSYTWRKKAERIQRCLLPPNMSWDEYYLIYMKKPFERNLIKNNSGEHGVRKHWKILMEGGNKWTVESPPQGVPPLPSNEPVFEGRQSCFVTSYHYCTKRQMINLQKEGLSTYILDNIRPPIAVSEWYSCRWDCPAVYECSIKLLGEQNEVLDTFQFRDAIVGELQNQWHCMSHEFENYGPGLRKISFCHGGIDKMFWAGHYGSKMAGACVYVKIPKVWQVYKEETDMTPNTD